MPHLAFYFFPYIHLAEKVRKAVSYTHLPGSRAFENPDEFGYTITEKTLADHIEAITRPSWKYILNYDSRFLTRDEMVEATYDLSLIHI